MEEPEFIILEEKDLQMPICNKAITCKGITCKGKKCKRKCFQDKDYCKIHCDRFKFEKPDECPVCMDSLKENDIPLSCGHWVHKSCILKWGKDMCPLCKLKIKLTQREKQKLNKNKQEINLPREILDFIDETLSILSVEADNENINVFYDTEQNVLVIEFLID